MSIKKIKIWLNKLLHKGKPSYRILSQNNIRVYADDYSKISLYITGAHNTVSVPAIKGKGKITIYIYGNHNKIEIKEGLSLSGHLHMVLGQQHSNFGEITGSSLCIGENTSIESMQYITYNSHTVCNIGRNCMISYGVTLYNTDAHPIFDKTSHKIINHITGIDIGEHCWLGMHSTILKNSTLQEGSILGCHSVYAKKATTAYCIWAGNPAKKIKENITWDKNGAIFGYINNLQEK